MDYLRNQQVEGLEWRGEGLYKEKATIKNGACNLRRKKKNKNTQYSRKLKLI